MFNPKGNNLLDDQMSVSGLEMEFLTKISDAFFGHTERKKANKRAKKIEEEQKKLAEETARRTNEHNDKLDFADKANYYRMREYSHNTNMRNWQHGKVIQDFEYLSRMMQFEKSTAIGNEQLGLNAEAMAYAIEDEEAAMKEAFIQQQFQMRQSMEALSQTFAQANIQRQQEYTKLEGIRSRQRFGNLGFQYAVKELMTQGALAKESEMVKGLITEGASQATAQAGKSALKTQQSNMAALHRGLMVLESELSGKYKQAAVEIAELNADSSLQKELVGLNLESIDLAVKGAQMEAQFNMDVMRANMESRIAQSRRNIREIGLQRRVADNNTRAGMMLPPIRLPYAPQPEPPPERVFVERMEAIPGYVPPAVQQNEWAPVITGAIGIVESIATGGLNFNSSGDYGGNLKLNTSNINYFG